MWPQMETTIASEGDTDDALLAFLASAYASAVMFRTGTPTSSSSANTSTRDWSGAGSSAARWLC